MLISAICLDCFKAGDHTGHDFRLYQSMGGGSCDCGIKDAWKEAGCATCSIYRQGLT